MCRAFLFDVRVPSSFMPLPRPGPIKVGPENGTLIVVGGRQMAPEIRRHSSTPWGANDDAADLMPIVNRISNRSGRSGE
jgi:hypothetical protein